MLTGAATVFAVGDIVASTAYYRDALGFEMSFEYGAPTFYAIFDRDEVAIHLIASAKTTRPPGAGAVCIFVENVDAVHADLVRRGAARGSYRSRRTTPTACGISTSPISTATS
jgi:catechol 2,3-dioxygenase-like lactoylglutathione lyase family enzyme